MGAYFTLVHNYQTVDLLTDIIILTRIAFAYLIVQFDK